MGINKKECTATIMGVIVEIIDKGLNNPTIVVVEYKVDMKTYMIKESLKLRNEVIKFGIIPIGQRKISKIDAKIGNVVQINYNPNAPEIAYITENEGIINC